MNYNLWRDSLEGKLQPVAPLDERVRRGMRAGLVAAAATGGALVAFGARDGGALRPFVLLGRASLGAPRVDSDAQLTVALVGVAVHAAAMCLWGVVLAAVVPRAAGIRLYAGAAAVATVACVVQRRWLPAVLRAGNEVTVRTPQIGRSAVLYLMLAVGLAVGMRVAHPSLRLEDRRRS